MAKIQTQFLDLINTEEGRYLLGIIGQKPQYPIVHLTKNAFIEHLGGKQYQATFFSKNPLQQLFAPILEKMQIANDEYKPITNKREAFLHYAGLEEKNNRYPRIFLTTSTFNPVAGANSPVDGRCYVAHGGADAWATIRGQNGDAGSAIDSNTEQWDVGSSGGASNTWAVIVRSLFAFDTSSLTASATISAATFSTYITAKTTNGLGVIAGLYLGTLASSAAVAASDYQGNTSNTTAQSDTTQLLSTCATSAYLDFALNATGLGNINKTGVTVFCGRATQDAANSQPTWVSGLSDVIFGNFADNGSNIPKLVVTFTTPASTSAFRSLLGVGI